MAFDLLDYPILAIQPRLLSVVSAWLGHIPFGLALVQMLEPSTIVELGTHQGDSYCAFCEAVLTLKLPTKCTAIDTWAGDRHSGIYDQDVLSSLRAVHDPAYGSFSQLLQLPFDDALEKFTDRSIDLLHIDGLHTLDAVRHDFETWLPKMSERGVILLHDTAERGEDFGVWQLWAEISAGRLHFEFMHSHGLGVLVVGSAPPARLLSFLEAANQRPDAMRALFARLGNAYELHQVIGKIMLPLTTLQANLNEWSTRTSRTGDQTPPTMQAAMEDPVAYCFRVYEHARAALLEDLTLRKL